jgi:hypothetical protein
MVRSLSEVGQTGTSGPGGGGGRSGGGGGSSGGGSNPFLPQYTPFPTSGSQIGSNAQNLAEAGAAGAAAYGAAYLVYAALGLSEIGPPGWIIAAGIGLFELFDELFGGGSDSPPVFRKLRHNRHPLYPVILGVPDGLTPDETSGKESPSNTPALQKQPQRTVEICRDAALRAFLHCIFDVYLHVAAPAFAPIISGCAKAAEVAGPEAPVGFGGCLAIAGAPAAIAVGAATYICYQNYQKAIEGCAQY